MSSVVMKNISSLYHTYPQTIVDPDRHVIRVGEAIPNVDFTELDEHNNPQTRSLYEVFNGKSCVLIGVHAAFDTVSTNYLCKAIQDAKAMKSKYSLCCFAPSAFDEMKKWKKKVDPESMVAMIPDVHRNLASYLGLCGHEKVTNVVAPCLSMVSVEPKQNRTRIEYRATYITIYSRSNFSHIEMNTLPPMPFPNKLWYENLIQEVIRQSPEKTPTDLMDTEFTEQDEKEKVKSFHLMERLTQKHVILLTMPGAHTPTCGEKHAPPYIKNYAEFEKLGIQIVGYVTNHFRSMMAWANEIDPDKKITWISDPTGKLIVALRLQMPQNHPRLGFLVPKRSAHFMQRHDYNTGNDKDPSKIRYDILYSQIDENAAMCVKSGADNMLNKAKEIITKSTFKEEKQEVGNKRLSPSNDDPKKKQKLNTVSNL